MTLLESPVLTGRDGIIQLTGLKALCRGVIGGSPGRMDGCVNTSMRSWDLLVDMGTPAHAPPGSLVCALRVEGASCRVNAPIAG